MSEEKLLTVEEVAAWLRVKPSWVRAHANGNRRPQIRSVKLGAHVRFRAEDVQHLIDECRAWSEQQKNS